MERVLRLILGSMLGIAGLIVLPLPLPFGLIMIAAAVVILLPASPVLRRQVRTVLRRFPDLRAKFSAWRRRRKADHRLRRHARLVAGS